MNSAISGNPGAARMVGGKPRASAFQLWKMHALVVAVPALMLLSGADPEWTLLAGGIVVTVGYLVIGYLESKREDFWLTPLSFFFFWYSLGYGVSAIYAASQIHDVGFLKLVTHQITGPDLAAGYVLSLIGALSLHGGFLWLLSKKPAETARSEVRSDFRLWALVFFLGVAMIVRPGYFSGIGSARAILQLAPIGILISFCSLPRSYFRISAPLYFVIAAGGNLLLVFAAFYSGAKFLAMFAFLPILSAILIRPRLRRALPILVATGALLYLFVVAPILMKSREIKGVDSHLDKLRIAADDTFNSVSEDILFSFQEETQKLLYRQFESTAVGFIVGDVREHGFQYGETMKNMTFAFIPRILWPDKPTVTRGNWFTAYLGGAGSEEEATTSTGQYSAGELYWNFGIPGVVVGMFLIGMFFGYLYTIVGQGPHQVIIPMIIFMNIIGRMVEEAAATDLYVLLIYLSLVAFLYHYFLQIETSRRSLGPSSRLPRATPPNRVPTPTRLISK